jgi:hypothetical protein
MCSEWLVLNKQDTDLLATGTETRLLVEHISSDNMFILLD